MILLAKHTFVGSHKPNSLVQLKNGLTGSHFDFKNSGTPKLRITIFRYAHCWLYFDGSKYLLGVKSQPISLYGQRC